MKPVLVVGGGIAGLAAAYELNRRGVPFMLMEASGRLGGVILSEQIDGYTIDGGPDALLVQKPEAIALCRELGLGDRLIPTKPPRLAFIQRGQKLHPLPSSSVLGIPTRAGPFLKTGLFSLAGKLRMGAEVFVPARRDEVDESIGAFMTRRFGAEATAYLAEPLLAGIHAGDVDRLSLRALFPRFIDAERTHGSLLRAFRRQPTPPSPDGAFRSLPGGLSEMVQALVSALPANAIHLNTPVARILTLRAANPENLVNPVNQAIQVATSTAEVLETPAVILATPAYVTAHLLRTADAELSNLCNEISYASTATIAMAFPRSAVQHPLNGSGFVVPRAESTAVLAATWLSSKWAHRAPEDRALIRVFVGGARDPQALDHSDKELVERSLNAIRPLLGITGSPLLERVYRWEHASAQHEVGHLARMKAIERALARQPGLFVTGSGFRGVGIPDCVADGRATAAAVSSFVAPDHQP